jgi:hypothetical protein
LDFDWTAGGDIALDDKVLGENTAAQVRANRVRPMVEVARRGLHLDVASDHRRAASLDQKRNERATRSAMIGEEARQPSALHKSFERTGQSVFPYER